MESTVIIAILSFVGTCIGTIKGTILPTTMADLYVQYGFRSANNGTYWSAFRWTADVFDIDYTETNSSTDNMKTWTFPVAFISIFLLCNLQ